jgi:anti-anti-sigma factor
MLSKIQSWSNGKTARLVLSGNIDAYAVLALRKVIEKLLSNAPDRLILYVNELDHLPSATLRNLAFACQKQPSLQIYFVQPQRALVDNLKASGFYESVYILAEDSEEPDNAIFSTIYALTEQTI